jgi:tetratricopeptide (TPR) repeat protein
MQRLWLHYLDPDLTALKLRTAQDPSLRIDLAKAYNSRGLHAEAIVLLDQLLAEDRANPDHWFERIVAVGDGSTENDLSTLHSELESLRDERPQEAAHRRNLGYLRLLQQRPDDAERALRQALERHGQDCRTLELMGVLSLQRDQPGEAKNWFLKALTLQPRDARTLRLLGLSCEQLGDYKSAEQHYAAALELDPSYFWGWHTFGEMLLRRGITEAGLRCIHRARSLCVHAPASYFLLSELFSEQGHLDLAQAELHALLALAPGASTMAEAYSLLGELRRDSGDQDGAVSYFSLAAETDPEAVNPWIALGDLAREENRTEDALRCYREALARDTGAADVQVQLGYVLLKTGRSEEAEQGFLAALEMDPSEYSAYLGLSECYRLTQRLEDQMRMVKEAMVLAPEDPDVWNAMGVSLELAGRLREATEAYEKALSHAPQHRKAANNLGFLLEKRMELGEAELRERAVEAWKRRFLICRDEGQSLKKAHEHLVKLGVADETILRWLEHERNPEPA